ncbi:MAG: phosphoribosyltransferase [Saprospiraceae bacterium]|jgi:pyrimidine operon attenuation protein/uracil phosphoribosyltransferase|nr:phosphoribosyltransferase [Saprospiraceae bacterium]MBV6472010.1 Bifunctional protein pyrR [Saprospiraceae bacterium]
MIILNKDQIRQKFKRMAIEMVERHADENELVLIGILDKGTNVANQLKTALKELSSIQCSIGQIRMNKKDPVSELVELNFKPAQLLNKSVILVDDVSNSGRTLFYALGCLMNAKPKSIETAVLVERMHKRFPVGISYYGMRLATTLKDHIEVQTSSGEDWTVDLH